MALSPGVRAILPGARPTRVIRQNFPIPAAGISGWWDFGASLEASVRNRANDAAPASVIGTPVVAESHISLTTGQHQLSVPVTDSTTRTLAILARVTSDTLSNATRAVLVSSVDSALPYPGARIYNYGPNNFFLNATENNAGAAVQHRIGHTGTVDPGKWRIIIAGWDGLASFFEDYTIGEFKTGTMTNPRMLGTNFFFGQKAAGGNSGTFDIANGIIITRSTTPAERLAIADWLTARAASKGLTLG